MSADIIPFPRVKTVRPVFPSITGSMTIPVKSMDDLPLTGGAADLIMGCADTAPCEYLPTEDVPA